MNKNAHLQPGVNPVAASMDNERPHLDLPSRNRPEKLAWLQDAGMGLFLHWSLDCQLGSVISHSLVGASKAYTDRFYELLPKTLERGEWDFDHMASLARLAGFRYGVLTTKHHNGFCLWPSESTPFNTENSGLKRNLVREFAEAFRRQGLAVGFYFSPEDFWFLREQGLTITREPKEPYSPAVEAAYRQHLKTQMTELMTQFGPVDVLFFDGGENMYGSDGINLQQYCMQIAWDLQPKVLITRGAIPTPEQRIPEEGEFTEEDFVSQEPWEACFTIGTAWQHQPTNEQYKSGYELIRLLMDTRSKGGALLLNAGPDALGRLCPQEEGVLRELALWHLVNEECVHGVRPWVRRVDGVRRQDKAQGTYCLMVQEKDASAVYAVVMDPEWKKGERREVLLTSVGLSRDSTVEVLGSSSEFTEYHPEIDAHVYYEETPEGLRISAVRAQRLYCGSEWPNPLVIRITHPVARRS